MSASYPARGTWIEMTTSHSPGSRLRVVPRTGYVDRNLLLLLLVSVLRRSYPARGTWIEMFFPWSKLPRMKVVPRTGYVDRNIDLTSNDGLKD